MKPSKTALSSCPSPFVQPCTPPGSPCAYAYSQAGTLDRFERASEKLVQALEKLNSNQEHCEDRKCKATELEAEMPEPRASKLDYKVVDEIWDVGESQYKVKESKAQPEQTNDLDKYVFIVRARTDRKTFEQVFFVDVKSDGLRDILRDILRDAHGVSLRDEQITVERNLLFHYVAELESHRAPVGGDPRNNVKLKHLDLLVEYINTTYASTKASLASYIRNGEITYDLLWALFKPNTAVYTTILDDNKPACYAYQSGTEKTTNNGITYFHAECRYLDFNGQMFGEASTAVGIQIFKGVKRVEALEAYPLEFHGRRKEVTEHFLRCGRLFISLMGQHHMQYRGNAFYIEKGEYHQIPVDSRIMVDVAFFRKVNPNYVRPQINDLARPSSDGICAMFIVPVSDEVKSGPDPKSLNDKDLILCSQTVYGWSFSNKRWLEFVVDNITDIVWNPSSFDNLAIPAQKKRVITALAKAHISRTPEDVFDDFVHGKGQGLITLLHGPPGVGKTLTAEGLSEYLERPLYSISAGELGQEAGQLETKLSLIFRLAHHWKAIVLLDEADVFVQARSLNSNQNALVSVFLRKLEYYQRVIFLTTNRVRDINDAIQSRISIALNYEPLSFVTRRTV